MRTPTALLGTASLPPSTPRAAADATVPDALANGDTTRSAMPHPQCHRVHSLKNDTVHCTTWTEHNRENTSKRDGPNKLKYRNSVPFCNS